MKKFFIFLSLFFIAPISYSQTSNFVFNVVKVAQEDSVVYETTTTIWHAIECGSDFISIDIDMKNNILYLDYDCEQGQDKYCLKFQDSFIPQWLTHNVKQYNFMSGGYATWDGLVFIFHIKGPDNIKTHYTFTQLGYVLNPKIKRT